MKEDIILDDVKKIETQVKELLSQNITHGLGRSLRNLQKEIQLFNNFTEGKNKWENSKSQFDAKKIQIGGGSHVLDGFLNVDIVPPADLVWDVREGLPFDENGTEYIFSEHFLEHIDYPTSVKKVISECFRITKDGGRIVIGVPDSELVLKAYNTKDDGYYKEIMSRWFSKRDCLNDFNTYIDLVNYHFRDQDDHEKYNPHFWAYDFEKMKSLLKNAGFKQIEKWDFDNSIANPKREWGSLYVTAIK